MDRHAAIAGQPAAQIVDADIDVVAQTRFGDWLLRYEVQKILGLEFFVALLAPLIGLVAEHRVEFFHRDRYQARMRDPAAVEAVIRIAFLVVAHAGQRLFIRGGVVLDRNQRRHAADGRRATPVAGLDQGECVGTHERHFHRDRPAIGQAEAGLVPEFLDRAEDVIPASGIEPCRVFAQLVENLVHFERRQDRFKQHGRLDRAARDAKLVLAP